MSKYLRIYAVVDDGNKILCGNPEFHDGHIYTRTELTIKVYDDNTIEKNSQLYEYFDKFLDTTLEGLGENNEQNFNQCSK
jgi:hypothetical protein